MHSLEDTLTWIGARIDDVYGARAGHVEDIYVDFETREPVWLAARSRRFGQEHVLVPVIETVAGAGRVWVPYPRDTIRTSPLVEPGTPLKQRAEQMICEHYAILGGRTADIAPLHPSALTAVPAAWHPALQTV